MMISILWLAVAVVALIAEWLFRRQPKRTLAIPGEERDQTRLEQTGKKKAKGPIVIDALPDFELHSTSPQAFRPWKPIYHISMAIQATTPSELIVLDTNYEERVLARRNLIATHPKTVLGAVPEGLAPVHETYTFLMRDYLPVRYPSVFTTDGVRFRNTVTGIDSPLAPPADPCEALRTLGETVEDDLFLLQETPDGHRVVAFVCCHPSGFDPSAKLGLVLRDVHKPVPGYDKIGGSMERFFSRLEVGKSVKRLNWAVTTTTDLFTPNFNHIVDNQTFEENQAVDIEKTRLRVELQTLTRLPETRAILFSFKTYLYPLTEIKDEGLGPEFADAIEGLKAGNAPGMWTYKSAARWGKSVCEYLRS